VAFHHGVVPGKGFTIVELLVSMAILSLIMVLLAAMVSSVSTVWRNTTGKISAFAEARAGFEAMTRKLSQATINSYWDYEYPNDDTTKPPRTYVRQSELHLMAGQASTLIPSLSDATTHAIFFQAPLGYSRPAPGIRPLPSLLNASGFFIQRSKDTDLPEFLKTLFAGEPAKKRTRYRLMEMWQPTEQFRVYQPKRTELSLDITKRTEWFTQPLASSNSPARPLAENVIALVLWPRRAATDPRPPITPDYSFDTRAYLSLSPATRDALPPENPLRLSRNQLPPVVQVTMVVLDGKSAAKLEELPDSAKTLLAPGALFTSFNGKTSQADQEQVFQEDLKKLTDFLTEYRLAYRVFTTAVTLRQAKWSEE